MIPGDKVQIIYKKDLSVEIIESEFISRDSEYIYLKSGKYLRKRIKALRNLSEKE